MSIMSQEAKKQLGCVLHWSGGPSSSNAPKQITAYGNVTQILPFTGAGIGMFDGTGDYLSIPDSDDWYFGNDNFCIEMLVNQPSSASCALIAQAPEEVNRWVLYTNTDNTARFYIKYLNSTIGEAVSPANFTFNVWHHVAVIGIAGTIYVAVDGVLGTGVTMSSPQIVGALTIGTQAYGGTLLNGNISELRITKGIARYTSNFTPPRRQLESDEHTKLLLHFNRNDSTFIDSSPSAHTITAYGNATQLTSPCGSGVAYFDGTGDYLSTADSDDWYLSTDYTIGFYIKLLSFPSVSGQASMILSQGAAYANCHYIGIQNSSGDALLIWRHRYADANNFNPSTIIQLNTWYYVECVKSGSNAYLYLDGELKSSRTVASTISNFSTALQIGYRTITDQTGWNFYFNGYLSEFHISKGIDRHTTAFTPQTTPFKPDPYTKLLLHMDGVGNAFYDASDAPGDNGFPILPDGVTVTPAGTFASVKLKNGLNCYKFDGSTNYISLSDHEAWNIYESDFTICGWIKFGVINTVFAIYKHYVDDNNQAVVYWSTSNVLGIYGAISSVVNFNYTCSFTPVVGTWYFITVVKSGSSCLMYIDLVPKTVTITQVWRNTTNVSGPLNIGRGSAGEFCNGNIKDLMVFKGKALNVDQIGAIMAETYIY